MRAAILLLLGLVVPVAARADGNGSRAASRPASRRSEARLEACVRALVEARGLNAYGDRPDTLYLGGTPLFDESTGQTTPWIDYMRVHHPELVDACRSRRR